MGDQRLGVAEVVGDIDDLQPVEELEGALLAGQGTVGLEVAEQVPDVDTVLVADAVVVTTPVYKAAYSGLLKAFLDVLPQFALRDKVVLPLATGGTPAHVLAIDYALRPVLASLAPSAITPGWFVLASQVALAADGDSNLRGTAIPQDWPTAADLGIDADANDLNAAGE